jgi:hypothetical protein
MNSGQFRIVRKRPKAADLRAAASRQLIADGVVLIAP